jgi:hypothetical protein
MGRAEGSDVKMVIVGRGVARAAQHGVHALYGIRCHGFAQRGFEQSPFGRVAHEYPLNFRMGIGQEGFDQGEVSLFVEQGASMAHEGDSKSIETVVCARGRRLSRKRSSKKAQVRVQPVLVRAVAGDLAAARGAQVADDEPRARVALRHLLRRGKQGSSQSGASVPAIALGTVKEVMVAFVRQLDASSQSAVGCSAHGAGSRGVEGGPRQAAAGKGGKKQRQEPLQSRHIPLAFLPRPRS